MKGFLLTTLLLTFYVMSAQNTYNSMYEIKINKATYLTFDSTNNYKTDSIKSVDYSNYCDSTIYLLEVNKNYTYQGYDSLDKERFFIFYCGEIIELDLKCSNGVFYNDKLKETYNINFNTFDIHTDYKNGIYESKFVHYIKTINVYHGTDINDIIDIVCDPVCDEGLEGFDLVVH